MVFRSTSSTAPTLTGGSIYNSATDYSIGGQTYRCISKGSATSASDTGLTTGTQYYYYFFAINNDYYSAASTANATTWAVPTVTTPTATSIGATNATLGGNVTATNGAGLTSRGTVWGTSAAPTTNSLAEGNTTTGTFTHSRTGLTANTLYTYRAYAVNSVGTGYSADATFTTLPAAPTVGNGSSATTSGFTANWTAPTMGSVAFTYTVEVDNDINFGSIDATVSSISSASTSQAITGLNAGTSYYYRVRAVNTTGAGANSSTSAAISTSAASAVISATASLTAMSTTYGTASTAQSFTVSGSNMQAGITITPPSGFEVSTSSTFASSVGTSGSPITVGTSGTISSTTIYVRLAATAVPGASGSYSGNIVLTSTNATNVNVATAASTVNTKALTISSPAVTTKVYDRTTAATITGSLSGVNGSDTVTLSGTGTFNSAAVGTSKAVTSTSTLGGANASYYTLTQPTGLTGNITAAPLTVTGASATSRVYNRTTTVSVSGGSLSGVISGDTVTLGGTPTGSVATAAVGTGKAVTVTGYSISGADNGNYSLTQPTGITVNITAAPLTVTGATATDRVYNPSSTTVTVSGGSLSGVISGDTVTLGGTPTGSIATATVGSGKAVTVSGYSISGADSGNYSLTQPSLTVNITKATPTISTAPTASGIKYAQALSSSSLTGGSGSVAGSFGWTDGTVVPAPGTASYSVTFTPTDTTNYNTAATTVSVTSQMAESRNTAGAASPTQPANIYLGDTNLTFGADTWGMIDGAWGNARFFMRYNNSDVSGGSTKGYIGFTNVDTKTFTSLQFTNTGTWYWGVQMDYGAAYGANFWHKIATNNWTAMSTNGVGSTLSVTVQALPDVTNLTFSSVGTTGFTLNWTKRTNSSAPSGYDVLILRSTSTNFTDPTPGTSYSAGNTIGSATVVLKSGDTSLPQSGLTQGTTYYYKIYSENWGYYSTGVMTNETPSTTPGTPTSIAITPGNAQLSVAFTAPANGGTAITDYEYSTDGSTFKSAATSASPVVITTVSGSSASLVNGTPYNIQIRARNARGVGTATTATSASPITTAGAPTITGITAGDQQLSVAFTAPSSTGGSTITDYKWSVDGTNYTLRAGTASPIVITGLTNGTAYTVRIRAVNGAGDGAVATAGSTATPIAAPTLTAATLGSALTSTYGTASTGVGFTAAGTSLTGNITVTAQSGFEVSTSLSSGYGSSVSVASGTTVYVRFAARRPVATYNSATAAVLSSTSASNVNVTTSASGNTVAQKGLTISGATATNRAYDTTTTIAVSGGSLVGVESGDTVTLGGTPTGTVASAAVGTGKTVTVTGYSISGADNGNYSLSQPTGVTVDITKATPTITTAPTASGIYYAQTLAASSLTGGSVSPSGGTWAWTTPSTVATPGTASYSATYTPTDTTNYNTATTNVSLTSAMAQARNTTGSATPGAPSSIYLGDTNRTFTSETWGTINGTNGRARLVISTNNDLTGGISQGYAAADNNDTNSLGSAQFTSTGTWYWGVQMDYGATFGTNFWYKTSTAAWTDMSTNGTGATLSVTVLPLPNPSSISFTSTQTNQTTLTWNAANAGGNTYQTLVVRHTSSSITDPTGGTAYNTNDSTGAGTVVYKGFGTSFTNTGLNPATTYYYKVYGENWNYYSPGAATNVTTPGIPLITINGGTSNVTTAVFTSTYGTATAAQSFTVAGTNLTANITATAPTGFRVSFNDTNISAYGSTATLTNIGGTNSGILYVRTSGSTGNAGNYDNVSVTLASTGATDRSITTPSSGNTISKKALTVTANDQAVVFGTTAAAVTGAGSVTYTGFENSETTSVITGTPTYTTTYTATTAAGTTGVTITPVVSGLSAANYSFTPANGTITVTPLNDPTIVAATKGSIYPMTRASLSWTKADNRDVLIVRDTSNSWTAPTTGVIHTTTSNSILGTGVVVYKGSGTSMNDDSLLPGTTYFYRFYSENYGTYSAGSNAPSVLLDSVMARNAGGAATPSVTLTNGTTNTLYVGDLARFSFDATDTIPSATDTNWGAPTLRLKFNDADLSTGALMATNGFTNATNKVVVATNRFTNHGAWYWGMQMNYGGSYGSAYWYKSSSSSYAAMASNGTGSTLSFTVTALPDPSGVTLTAGTTSNTISFTRTGRSGGEFAAFVVRKANAAVDWTPTPGTTYTNGFTTNGNVVLDAANFSTNSVDSSLSAGTTYHYKVFSENWGYYSAGATSSITTVPSAPALPTISAVTATNFTATWVNPGGATNYFLDVSTVTNFATFVTGYSNKAVAGLSDSVTGLAANTTYYVRVRAQSSGGTSTDSPTASQLTAPLAPSVPTAASVLASSFTINWSSVTGASSYRLDVATDSGFTSFVTGFNDKSVSALTDSLTGLTGGTTYYARVRAVGSGGTSASSPTLTVATAASATAPAISSIVPGNTQLTVNFTPGESGGLTVTGYEYSLNAGAYTSAVQTSSPIIITGLTNGTSYTVLLRAVNDDGSRGSASGASSATPRTVPGAPTLGAITAQNGQLSVAFSAPDSDGGSAITDYKWSIDGTNFTLRSGTASPIVVTGLTNGTAYTVRILAVNEAGDGAVATASSTATPITIPTVTTGVASSVGSTAATLAGNLTALGGTANATERGIFYSTTSGFADGAGTKVSDTGTFSTGAFSNRVTGLAKNTAYYFKAFAVNAAGTHYGSQATFTTLNAPDGLNPASSTNPTLSFIGDTVNLNIRAWQSWNTVNRGYATVFGRFDNPDLTSGTTEGAGRDPGSADADFFAPTPRFNQTGTFYWAMRVSYGSGADYYFDRSMADWAPLASTLPSSASLAITVQPLNSPTGQAAVASNSTSINLSWTKGVSGSPRNTMIVRSTDTNFTAPTPGTAYTNGSTALGGDTVIYNDGGTSVADTGLNPNTTYYYRLYAENWSYYSAGADASAATPGTPTITIGGVASNATTTAFTTTYGTPSAAQNFTIGGSNLTANLTATAPAGYQVSTNDSTYTNAVTFTPSGGAASGTLYLRLSGTAAAGSYNSASVTLASTDATSRTITTPSTGNTVSQATPTISLLPSVSTSVMKGDTLSNGLLTNGTASVGGGFSFSDTSTRQTATGAKALTFTPTDTTNYTTVTTNVNVTVDDVPDPTSVTATNGGTNSINLTHSRASSRNVMIVRRAGSAVDWTPTDGTTYTNGFTTNGQTVVHGSLAADSSTDSGLAVATTYHYKIFSENWGYYSAGVTASATTATPAPSISVSGTVSGLTTSYGTPSSPGTFTAAGTYLTNAITVSAPAGFEVSTSTGSGYGASVSLTPSSGTVSSTTIYVRLAMNAAPGSNSGNVTLSSGGATSQTVAVSGTVSIPAMSMTIASSAGSMNADYTTSKLYADEVAGTTNNVTISFNTGNSAAAEVEVWSNLNNRDRADNDANTDGIQDGIVPPNPPTDKPSGYVSGAYPSDGYFQAHPMSLASGTTYTLTLNANKTGAYRLTARYRVNGGRWVYYNEDGGKRDHAITVTPVLARNMNVYEINVLNVNATGANFSTRSTFESLTNSSNGRVNLDYLRNMGVNTLWFQPIHPNGVEGREAPGGTPYDPGSPYAVKNFFEVMEVMSQGNTRAASMTAFTNFVAAADAKGVHVMLDAPFNHTAYDVELAQKGLELLAASGLTTTGWSSTDKIKDREARFFSKNNSGSQYSGPASSAGNIAAAPDRNDFGKWNDVIDVFFGRYSALVTGNPSSGAALNQYKSEADGINMDDLNGTAGAGDAPAVTRAVWQYFASYVPYWLEKTGVPAGTSLADQATMGIDGLRADFGQGMPPQFWEYAINVARERKWSFVFMSESLDGGEVTYRSNRHFDILNENIVFPWQNATNTTAHRTIFEDRRAAYGQGLVLLNNTSHDEAGWSDPWEAFIRYAVGSTIDGAPMIMYGQEIGTAAALSFDHYEVNFGKSIPHFKRYNSMNPQWNAWNSNSLGVKNLMPNYSGVGLAREFSPALRSSNRWFLNKQSDSSADQAIFAVAKYETANASPATSDVVLAFINLQRNSSPAQTFKISSELATLLGLESGKLYNVKNIAAYLGPNNEYPNRRNQFLWPTPRSGGDIQTNGVYVALNAVPSTDGAWSSAPFEAQYLKVYAAPVITTGSAPGALASTYGSPSTNGTMTFSATDVQDGLTITAPGGFQISTNSSSGFTNALGMNNTGTIGNTTLYVRLAASNNAGSYTGNLTFYSPGGNTNTVALTSSTVAKATPTITTNPTAAAITYGQALSAATLTGGAANVEGSFAFASPSTVPAATLATSYDVVFTPTDTNNYTPVTNSVSVMVNKKPLSITAPTIASKVYDGTTTAGAVTVGTITGTVGTETVTATATAAPYASANVGSYSTTVTYTLGNGINGGLADNYSLANGVATGTITAASVASNQISLTPGAGNVYTANGPTGVSLAVTYTGRTANGITTTYSSATAPSAPGYYTATASAEGNHAGSSSTNFHVAGPVAVNDTLQSPTQEMNILHSTLLANDRRIHSDGSVQTDGLSISAAANGSGSATRGATYIAFNAGGTGARTFTYTLSYGAQTATGTVTVTAMDLQANALALSFDSCTVTYDADGDTTTAVVRFTGTPGKFYYIQFASVVGQPWEDAGGWETGDGTFEVTITKDGNYEAAWKSRMAFKAQMILP